MKETILAQKNVGIQRVPSGARLAIFTAWSEDAWTEADLAMANATFVACLEKIGAKVKAAATPVAFEPRELVDGEAIRLTLDATETLLQPDPLPEIDETEILDAPEVEEASTSEENVGDSSALNE